MNEEKMPKENELAQLVFEFLRPPKWRIKPEVRGFLISELNLTEGQLSVMTPGGKRSEPVPKFKNTIGWIFNRFWHHGLIDRRPLEEPKGGCRKEYKITAKGKQLFADIPRSKFPEYYNKVLRRAPREETEESTDTDTHYIYSLLPYPPKSEQGMCMWIGAILTFSSEGLPFDDGREFQIEKFDTTRFPDLHMRTKDGDQEIKAELELNPSHWDWRHTRDMKGGMKCKYLIVWEVGNPSETLKEAFKYGLEWPPIVLKDIINNVFGNPPNTNRFLKMFGR